MPSVILFDGVCNLCNGFVRFVIARDPAGRFTFGALQSEAAQRLLASIQSRPLNAPLPDSILLIEDGHFWMRSDAALRVARGLTRPWPLVYALVVVPRALRDWVYDIVARHRYRWFGRQKVCMVPTPALRSRFVDAEPPQGVDTASARPIR
jgi:predicted DCC family thiol-disulfide oxidoreductase YuxK